MGDAYLQLLLLYMYFDRLCMQSVRLQFSFVLRIIMYYTLTIIIMNLSLLLCMVDTGQASYSTCRRVRACVRVCMRASVRACVCACVRACMCSCVRACRHVCVYGVLACVYASVYAITVYPGIYVDQPAPSTL